MTDDTDLKLNNTFRLLGRFTKLDDFTVNHATRLHHALINALWMTFTTILIAFFLNVLGLKSVVLWITIPYFIFTVGVLTRAPIIIRIFEFGMAAGVPDPDIGFWEGGENFLKAYGKILIGFFAFNVFLLAILGTISFHGNTANGLSMLVGWLALVFICLATGITPSWGKWVLFWTAVAIIVWHMLQVAKDHYELKFLGQVSEAVDYKFEKLGEGLTAERGKQELKAREIFRSSGPLYPDPDQVVVNFYSKGDAIAITIGDGTFAIPNFDKEFGGWYRNGDPNDRNFIELFCKGYKAVGEPNKIDLPPGEQSAFQNPYGYKHEPLVLVNGKIVPLDQNGNGYLETVEGEFYTVVFMTNSRKKTTDAYNDIVKNYSVEKIKRKGCPLKISYI